MKNENVEKAVSVAGKTARVGFGIGLILLDVVASALGTLVCAITYQD